VKKAVCVVNLRVDGFDRHDCSVVYVLDSSKKDVFLLAEYLDVLVGVPD
jgi:hypothetical protein